MNKKMVPFIFASGLLATMLAASASAQAQRTFVSGSGSDSNPCSRTAPCRNFAQAISQTSAAGEVVVLDSAGYGPFAITRSVSITAPPGVYAGISAFPGTGTGNGIDINASASDTVILHGLTINNQGSNGGGIFFNSGATLHMAGCTVNGFSNGGAGVNFRAAGRLEVKDSIIRGNFIGIDVQPASGIAHVTIERARMESNNFGVAANEGSKVTVRNSVASGNGVGFFCLSNSSTVNAMNPEMNLESCVAANNDLGVYAQSTQAGVATIRVSNCTVTNNSVGLQGDNPAEILSRGNNTVRGNVTDTSGKFLAYHAF